MIFSLISLIFLLIHSSFGNSNSFGTAGNRAKRNALLPTENIPSTYGVIPYFIDNEFHILDAKRQQVVRAALNFIEDRTCVEFYQERTLGHRIRFEEDTFVPFCYAVEVGIIADEEDNIIQLTANCGDQVPLVIRYIMHLMGLVPNSARPDVSIYMTVNRTNFNNTFNRVLDSLTADTLIENFIVPLPPFEYGSILSYGASEFSSEANPVFVAAPDYTDYQNSMGTGRVTFQDIKMINDLYECVRTRCTGTAFNCSNGGYPNPRDCNSCNCPDGYSGQQCSDLPVGNATERTQGVNLMASAVWQQRHIEFGQDPSIPIRDEFKDRVDWITSPANRTTELRIIYLYENGQPNPGCTKSGVELKIESETLAGVRLCTQSLVNKIFTSKINPTPIISFNRYGWTTFKVEYRYV